MTYQEFLSQSWADHAKNATAVAAQLSEGFALIKTNEELPSLAQLATHVLGEHLGKWTEGLGFLAGLRSHPAFQPGSEADAAISRCSAALDLCLDEEVNLAPFSCSDQIRILALAACALSAQKQPARASSYFQEAMERTHLGLAKEDPANRALAVTGNNLACSLEENMARSEEDTKLMILAAEAGRKYWELAGGWVEVCWAEYRLAMTYTQAARWSLALEHAQACAEITEENGAGALERFFSFEAIATVEGHRKNKLGYCKALESARQFFAQVGEGEKASCEASLKRLEKLFA